MYLAHAGHDHAEELSNVYSSTEFLVGVVMLLVAVLTIVYVVYDMRKTPKVKSKR